MRILLLCLAITGITVLGMSFRFDKHGETKTAESRNDPDTNALLYVHEHEHECAEVDYQKAAKRYNVASNKIETVPAFSAYKCSGVSNYVFVHYTGGATLRDDPQTP